MPNARRSSLEHALHAFFISGLLAAGLLVSGAAAHAVTVEARPGGDGYIVHLAPGESASEAWYAIQDRREIDNPQVQPGDLDIIDIGPGSFSMTDALGNRVLHYWSGGEGLVAPPLVIRGAGADATTVTCGFHRLEFPCAYSSFGLIFEDLRLATNGYRSPIAGVSGGDLTLRRVRVAGQSLPLYDYSGVFSAFNGNLTVEDSVLSDNVVSGGEGLLKIGKNNGGPYVARVVRSVIAGNSATALVDLSMYQNGGVSAEIEQSTLVENAVGTAFLGVYGEIVSASRSILDDTSTDQASITLADSFIGPDSELVDNGLGARIPRPTSPVIDALDCAGAAPFDQRGLPTGVPAVYYPTGATACDYGAVEAQHTFCMATDQGTVACDEGSLPLADVASLGCRLIGGLLDCGGGQEAELTALGPGESLLVGTAELLMQTDGNLVLYDDGIARWSTGTDAGPCIGHSAVVQADGSLAVLSDPAAPGGAVTCFTTGVGGDRVVVRQGYVGEAAQLVVERADGSVAWITTHNGIPAGRAFALQGSRLRPGDSLSIDGARVEMQWDGDLVLYDTVDGLETATWSLAGGSACAGEDAVFGADGRLVIGEPGTACYASAPEPNGAGVLRLRRTALGSAVLSWLSPWGEELWKAPQPPPAPSQCSDLAPGSPDGVYTMTDSTGVEREVYCDMLGGGWMLVGKVYRSHQGGSGLPEPTDWWTAGTGQVDALVPGTVDWSGGSAYAAYGSAWLAELDLDLARFDMIAELADPFTKITDAVPGQTGTWYKDPSTVATWFSAADTTATTVCGDAGLSCGVTGRIYDSGNPVWLEGMRLPGAGGWIHLRPDTDALAYFDGVCSYTGDDPSWLDSAAGHWGNGLDIWVKKHRTRAKCGDFPAGSPDGVYTVVDGYGVEREVYCDMTGGGWMLVGQVYRSHLGASGISEPDDWWTAGTGQVGAMTPGVVEWTSGSGYAAYGADWLAGLGLSVARFDVIAEDATPFQRIADAVPGQTGTWFKKASTIATWFSPDDLIPTAVCADEALSCAETGRIRRTSDATWLEGMRLPGAGGWIHLRSDGDIWPAFDGVCSYTGDNPSWLDDAAGHWGNSLNIWVK